jgi:biotin transporter BioY
LFGYLHFYVAALLVIGMKTHKAKITTISTIYAIAIVANVIAFGFLGWNY